MVKFVLEIIWLETSYINYWNKISGTNPNNLFQYHKHQRNLIAHLCNLNLCGNLVS
jgi:hypothetical protein